MKWSFCFMLHTDITLIGRHIIVIGLEGGKVITMRGRQKDCVYMMTERQGAYVGANNRMIALRACIMHKYIQSVCKEKGNEWNEKSITFCTVHIHIFIFISYLTVSCWLPRVKDEVLLCTKNFIIIIIPFLISFKL